MKRFIIFMLLILICISVFAELAMDEFVVLDKKRNINIELGEKFSEIIKKYPDISYIGEKKYSNIIYKRYEANGIIFSISAYAKSEQDAILLSMEIISNNFFTKRGVTIGCTKENVISIYGNADFVQDNIHYFINSEWDVLELKFQFNEKGTVASIELFAGT